MTPDRQADQFECVHEDIPGRKIAVFWDDEDTGPYSNEPRNFNADSTPVKPGWYWADVEYEQRPGFREGTTFTKYLTDPAGPYPDSEGAYLAAIGD